MTLTEFLTARLDEDEADARDDDGSPTPIGMWDPDRVLAEVAAKRAIVDKATDYDERWALDEVLRHIAAPYADHPDYDEAWRP
jgi:hypothetical protein